MTFRPPPGIEAVFFDMDGTLIDSERLTDVAVAQLITEHDLPPPTFALAALHGISWERIEDELVAHYPVLAGRALAGRLQDYVDARMRADIPPAIPGAVAAFVAASLACITGIVSSSPRATIASVADKLGLNDACHVLVGAEDVVNSKPDPECYRVAAKHAQVAVGRCLVFEDSAAGVRAAKDAGAYVIGVRGNRSDVDTAHLSDLADQVIRDYRDLDTNFFTGMAL